MTEAPRILAVCGSYLELVQAFRDRLRELGISYATFDELAGWTDSYASKIFGAEPMKRMGTMSLDAAMGAAGVRLAMIEDPVALERVKRSCQFVKKRHKPHAMRTDGVHPVVVQRVTREFMRQIAALGGMTTARKLPKRRKSALAKKAAKARWRKPGGNGVANLQMSGK